MPCSGPPWDSVSISLTQSQDLSSAAAWAEASEKEECAPTFGAPRGCQKPVSAPALPDRRTEGLGAPLPSSPVGPLEPGHLSFPLCPTVLAEHIPSLSLEPHSPCLPRWETREGRSLPKVTQQKRLSAALTCWLSWLGVIPQSRSSQVASRPGHTPELWVQTRLGCV